MRFSRCGSILPRYVPAASVLGVLSSLLGKHVSEILRALDVIPLSLTFHPP